MSTQWNLEPVGVEGVGILFNVVGIPFNQIGIQFGGQYINVWTLQTGQ